MVGRPRGQGLVGCGGEDESLALIDGGQWAVVVRKGWWVAVVGKGGEATVSTLALITGAYPPLHLHLHPPLHLRLRLRLRLHLHLRLRLHPRTRIKANVPRTTRAH